jgi:hypothetical protein
MKRNAFNGGKRTKTFVVASILACAGLAPAEVFAQSLAIDANSLTITGGGSSSGFSETATFGTNGVVEHIGNVPTSSGVGIPNFAFTLDSTDVTPNSSYEFTVFVVFDREGNQSRIESRLTRLIINVDVAGNVTGSIPSAGNELKVIGRTSGGTVELEFTTTNLSDNGPVELDGGTVTFNADNLISKIRASNAAFDSFILDEFDDAATYTYRIVVEQTIGTPLQFNHVGVGDVLTALPTVADDCGVTANCTAADSAFILDNSEYSDTFTGGYTVTGSFTVGAASPSPSPSPSASASPSPTPSVKTFALEDNELIITGSGPSNGFFEFVEFDDEGVVEHVTDVPTTGDFGIPSFSFDLITNAIPAGSYEFAVGVVFDKENSQSRIEAYLPRLILTVAGNGQVTGSIPALTTNPAVSNAVHLLARDGSGNIQVSINVENAADNGPVRLDGNSVTFDADYLIERISNSNAAFSDIILEQFDQVASYSYRIAVDQSVGTAIQFSHYDEIDGFTALPKVLTVCNDNCVASDDAFILDDNEFAQYFADAFSVTGSFNVVPFTAPTPDPDTGVPPLPDDFDGDLGDLLDDLEALFDDLEFDVNGPSEEQLDQLENAFEQLEEQLANAEELLASGELSISAGFTLLNTGGQTFDIGGNASDLGGDFDVGGAAGTLGGFADVINGMINQQGELTQDQIDDIVDFTETKLESAAKMISNSTPQADVEKMMEATADLLNRTLDAGGELSEELVAAAVQIALKAVSNIAGDVVAKLGLGAGFDVNNQAQVQQLLRSEPAALTSTLFNTPQVESRTKVDQAAARQNLGDSGINPAAADRIVAALGSITNPNGVALPGGQNATSKLLTALARAFGGGTVNGVLAGGLNLFNATSFAVNVDAVTGALRVRADAASYAASSTAVRLVPSTIPEGVNYTSDGRAVAVADGVAIELAPAPVDVLGFASAVERSGFPASFRSNGTVELNLGSGQRFSGTFAYDNIGSSTTSCGAITFGNPQGAANSASYAFTMTCANGIVQRIVPFVDNAAFYTTVANSGLTIRTDRNTGAVTIGTVGRFKPSFFVNAPTTADQAFLTQNGTNGFAFRSRDVNGDGRADYEIISASGVQVMYAMP